MEQETYIVNFNTQGPYVVDAADLANVKFNLTWGSLPQKYSKFRVKINFRSNAYLPGAAAPAGSVLTDVGFININFGKSYVFDGSQNIGNVAMFYPVVTNTIAAFNSSYYCCTTNDNGDYMIDYPQPGIFSVTLKTFAGVAVNLPQHYNLQMLFIGVVGPNIGHSNLLANKLPTTN